MSVAQMLGVWFNMRTLPMLARLRSLAAVVALSMLVAACSDEPESSIPTSPGPPTVLSVDISGPDTLAHGESAQFAAVLNLSNFASKASSNVRWIASPPSFLRVDASGLATATNISGGAAVTADVTLPDGKVLRRSKGVIVLPTGTFLVVGTVTDAELPAVPVVGARVAVTPGGVEAFTDSNGFYRAYGVPPDAEIRVTAAGYEPLVQTIGIGGSTRQDFRLALSGPRLNLAGAYTLTLEAVSGCGSASPLLHPNWRQRQYEAVITQSGITLQVVLTEPRFQVIGGAGNSFRGQVTATGATFNLTWVDDFQTNVMERLPDGTLLLAYGGVAATGSAASLTGTLGGSLGNYAAGYPAVLTALGFCDSPRFTLTRR